MPGTIRCDQVREGLREYLEADAADPGSEVVRRHLQDCEGCRRSVAQLDETSRLLSRLPEVPMPAAMKDRLIAAFRDAAS